QLILFLSAAPRVRCTSTRPSLVAKESVRHGEARHTATSESRMLHGDRPAAAVAPPSRRRRSKKAAAQSVSRAGTQEFPALPLLGGAFLRSGCCGELLLDPGVCLCRLEVAR